MSHCHDSHECSVPAADAKPIIEQWIEDLREYGFRRTDALVDLLQVMIQNHQPYTLAQLAEVPKLKKRDQATIYRLIMKLKDAGRIRQLNLAGRVSHFQIVLPEHHHDYLVCEYCGTVSEVPMDCTLGRVEKEISAKLGWQSLRHELEFFGVCPDCVKSGSA